MKRTTIDDMDIFLHEDDFPQDTVLIFEDEDNNEFLITGANYRDNNVIKFHIKKVDNKEKYI